MTQQRTTADYRGPVLDIIVGSTDDWSESFTIQFSGVTANLTGETWAASVKRRATDSAALVSFTVDNSQYASGIVTISLTDTQISGLLASGENRFAGVWSLQRTTGSTDETWCRGAFIVERNVT